MANALRELADDVENRGIREWHLVRGPEFHVGVDEKGYRTYTRGHGESISLELRWATLHDS